MNSATLGKKKYLILLNDQKRETRKKWTPEWQKETDEKLARNPKENDQRWKATSEREHFHRKGKRQEEDLIIMSRVKEIEERREEVKVEEEKETQNGEIQRSQENLKEAHETKEEDKEVQNIQEISEHIQVTEKYNNLLQEN